MYGIDCIKRACFLESGSWPETKGMDHMGGGISREKRSVDYAKEIILRGRGKTVSYCLPDVVYRRRHSEAIEIQVYGRRRDNSGCK